MPEIRDKLKIARDEAQLKESKELSPEKLT